MSHATEASSYAYLTNASLAADITGDLIRLDGRVGDLTVVAVTTAPGTKPNGQWYLQGTLDNVNYPPIPAASAELPAAGDLDAGTYVWSWEKLNFDAVRLFWDYASGGTSSPVVNARVRVR